jgi:hypothetical protein
MDGLLHDLAQGPAHRKVGIKHRIDAEGGIDLYQRVFGIIIATVGP